MREKESGRNEIRKARDRLQIVLKATVILSAIGRPAASPSPGRLMQSLRPCSRLIESEFVL